MQSADEIFGWLACHSNYLEEKDKSLEEKVECKKEKLKYKRYVEKLRRRNIN